MSLINNEPAPTPAPPPAPGTTNGQTPPAPPPSGGDWVSGLPDELKSVVSTKGYKTPADVVQAYVNAERLIGTDKIPVPKDGVWDAAARIKLGIPEQPTGYKYDKPQLPEGMGWDDKFEQTALTEAHKLGLTPVQVKGLMDLYAGQRASEFQGAETGRAQERESVSAALKQEWGNAFNTKVDNAGRAARYLGGDALIDALETSGAGNNPEIIKAFAKIGDMLKEDQMAKGTPSGFNMTPAEALKEANRLMASESYSNKGHLEHRAVVEKVQALFRQAYPEG